MQSLSGPTLISGHPYSDFSNREHLKRTHRVCCLHFLTYLSFRTLQSHLDPTSLPEQLVHVISTLTELMDTFSPSFLDLPAELDTFFLGGAHDMWDLSTLIRD